MIPIKIVIKGQPVIKRTEKGTFGKISYEEHELINGTEYLRDIVSNSGRRKALFICKYCGKEFIKSISDIKSGNTLSCGCYQKLYPNRKVHGLRKHPLYSVYRNMLNRCYYPNHTQYKDWGGRGISVCEEWRNNFIEFYKWSIENGWELKLQIDRIDNDGDYEPNNCRFVTSKVNNNNRRNTGIICCL